METRVLGNSDMQITRMGVGAWAMGGGGWQWSWGPQNDSDSIAAIHAALDSGVNWIDTAAVYGLGHSEEVIGQALKGCAKRPYVFTKCERVWNDRGDIGGSLKAESIQRECEASLRRLRVDVIDLYQIHWPQPDEDIEEGWTEMARLQAEGKVRWIGVSNFDAKQIRRAQAIAPVVSLQPRYSILARDVEREILPYCKQSNIGVLVYSPMHSGLLTGTMTRERIQNFSSDDWRRRDAQFQEPNLSRNLRLVGLLQQIGLRHGRTPSEVAIAWTLRHDAVTGAIVGVRSAEQVQGILGAAEFRLSDSEVLEVEQALEQKQAA